MAGLDDLAAIVGEVAGLVGPSVVRIGRGPGRGGGFVVAPGSVVTNAHNLRGPDTTVTLDGGRVVRASLAGQDVDGDLAVLHLDTGDVPAVSFAEAQVVLGTPVLSVTRAPGGSLGVTVGTVSGLGRRFRGPRGREITGAVEHTAPLARGGSGSPLVDRAGRVVGISTHRLGEGFYLARPADAGLRAEVEALSRGEVPRRRYLGVSLLSPQASRWRRAAVGLETPDGLLVRAVDPEAAAAWAGIRPGDLLVEAAGRSLVTPEALSQALAGIGPGGTLRMRLLRGADELEVTVHFAGPAAEDAPDQEQKPGS